MGSSGSPADWISTLVKTRHQRGILHRVLPLEDLSRRVSLITTRFNNGAVHNCPDMYRNLVKSYYLDGDTPPTIPIIPGAIAFFANPNPPHEPAPLSTPKYECTKRKLWHALDVEVEDETCIVPLAAYVPYKDQSYGRTRSVLSRVDPLPFWVVPRAGGLGIPVETRDRLDLHHGDVVFRNIDGNPRTTVSVRFTWPGYEAVDKQIRVDSKGDDSGTYNRVLDGVLRVIRNFVSENTETPCEDPLWAVGNSFGQISAKNLVLLAIVVVSRGAITPIVQLCDSLAPIGPSLPEAVDVPEPLDEAFETPPTSSVISPPEASSSFTMPSMLIPSSEFPSTDTNLFSFDPATYAEYSQPPSFQTPQTVDPGHGHNCNAALDTFDTATPILAPSASTKGYSDDHMLDLVYDGHPNEEDFAYMDQLNNPMAYSEDWTCF
ncbi:unnamed protein product [Peniophora sp. CBMAI 1063]|nr:unnamed protein product [Peniophora sp. CBMAI 1063]